MTTRTLGEMLADFGPCVGDAETIERRSTAARELLAELRRMHPAASSGLDESEREEVIHQALFNLLQTSHFPDRNPGGYLYAVLKNEYLEWHARKRQARRFVPIEAAKSPAGDSPAPDEEVGRKRVMAAAREAAPLLDPDLVALYCDSERDVAAFARAWAFVFDDLAAGAQASFRIAAQGQMFRDSVFELMDLALGKTQQDEVTERVRRHGEDHQTAANRIHKRHSRARLKLAQHVELMALDEVEDAPDQDLVRQIIGALYTRKSIRP